MTFAMNSVEAMVFWMRLRLLSCLASRTPPSTYQLCKDAEAPCLLSGPLGLLRRRQARPHEELAAARVEELHALRYAPRLITYEGIAGDVDMFSLSIDR